MTETNIRPNPLSVFGAAPRTQVAAVLDPAGTAKIVRPGLIPTEHDGVVKAKHLKDGQTVRAYLHGEPRGGERTVRTVNKIDDGAFVEIEWASGHPTATYKAAYRWHDAALAGTIINQPALVTYQEV